MDDDLDLSDALAKLLEIAGYTARTAKNGEDAMRILRSVQMLPSLILLDLRMSVMSGMEFREQQLNEPRLANIPIVVMTADRSVDHRDVPGSVDWLEKPFGFGELVETVGRYLHG